MEEFCMFGIGDCGSTAKTVTDIVNESVTNVIMSSSQSCGASMSANQQLTFSNIKTMGCNVNFSNISQEADLTQNFSCSQNSDQSATLAAKFKTELDAKTEAVTTGLFPSPSDAETITKLKNKVVANIDISSISTCVASFIANQNLTFGKLDIDCTGADDKSLNFNNIKQKLTMTQVAKCIQSSKAAADATTEFENKLKLLTSAKSEGLDIFASCASLGSFMIPLIISIVLCIVIASVMIGLTMSN